MMDSRDATCGSGKQSGQITETPRREGFYWLKRKGFDDTVVKVFCFGTAWYVSFPGVMDATPLDMIHNAGWHGPILPPPN